MTDTTPTQPETVAVNLRFGRGRVAHDSPGSSFPVVIGTCTRCGRDSWEHGCSKESVELMMDHLAKECRLGNLFTYVQGTVHVDPPIDDEPDVETVFASIAYLDLVSSDDPECRLPATCAQCSRCHVQGWALGRYRPSVEAAIADMRSSCPFDGGSTRSYVIAPGTKVEESWDPFAKPSDHDAPEEQT